MATDFGIDLGTARTIIYSGASPVLDEPSVVAVETHTGDPVSYGKDAYPMIGRTPDRITAITPIERGAIANYDVAEMMMRHFIGKISDNKMLKARVIVATPSGITVVQQRSIMNVCEAAGARDVCLIEAQMAAAIGLSMDFTIPRGSIIVDIGAGTCDVAVLSMGGIAQCESAPIAGIDFNEAIARYVKREYNVLIGPHTAEKIKVEIGCVIKRPLLLTMTCKGRNQFTGLPQAFEINTDEVREACGDTAIHVCKAIAGVIEKTPPEMVGDISGDGLLLTGGGALLHGLPEFIAEYTGLKVERVADPISCVARGTGKAFKNFGLLKQGDYRFRTLQDMEIG